MFLRLIEAKIKADFFKGKVIIITGARQTGKTTLVKRILADRAPTEAMRFFNGDDPNDRNLLNNRGLDFLLQQVGNARIIFIDEAQKIPTIGQTLKLLADHFGNERQIIATGSSSINLLSNTQEALTGRKFIFTLYPLSWQELFPANYPALLKNLETLLLYGQYPEVASAPSFDEKRRRLGELVASYLYKDILELYAVKNAEAITNLLKALALQIGNQVSYTELSGTVGLDKKTVERYVYLLEQAFIIFRVAPYATNKRHEIRKLKKIYFCDLGVRNTIINNFNLLNQRSDTGALWENLLMVERLKFRHYHNHSANMYFWRSYGGAEVDLVEEAGGQLHGYEFKWGTGKQRRAPALWAAYPQSSYQVIDKEKLTGFVF